MGKLMLKKILVLLLLTVSNISCNENNKFDSLQNESVISNQNKYKQTSTKNYTITDVELNGDLLSVKISSSGCNAGSWKTVLVDANQILESDPVQRNIKLSLENNEACLAVFEKNFTFNIKSLKENYTKVTLNLEGWNSQIIYN